MLPQSWLSSLLVRHGTKARGLLTASGLNLPTEDSMNTGKFNEAAISQAHDVALAKDVKLIDIDNVATITVLCQCNFQKGCRSLQMMMKSRLRLR